MIIDACLFLDSQKTREDDSFLVLILNSQSQVRLSFRMYVGSIVMYPINF